MKLRKNKKNGEESYWKSFTDIMAGLLLVILLILMLLLLYMTQMNRETHEYDHEYDYSVPYDVYDDYDEGHKADEMYDRPPQDGGGGGGGSGVDDPGTGTSDGIDNDYGRDKAAVFVTVIDEETGKAIKKEGITFELYSGTPPSGSRQTLNTYYPIKVSYENYETTKEGNFFLPEKIKYGWYYLHNIVAPKGYGFAEDTPFEITESRDWTDPYQIIVPMSPSKGIIYIQSVNAETQKNVAGGTYEVYAEEDVVTLDGTLRYAAGTKVDEFTCDQNGKGASKKIYYGKYSVRQKAAAQYYAVNTEPLSVTLEYKENAEDEVYTVECQKTKYTLNLVDDETGDPVEGAEFTVTGKNNLTTDENGRILISDLEKSTPYTFTLVSVPEPYRMKDTEVTVQVDANGLIDGKAVAEQEQTVYIIRLVVSVKDMFFGNEVSMGTLRLYGQNDAVVEEWSATGKKEEFPGLEPGSYTLEVDGNKSSRIGINLKDEGGIQNLETSVWTLWDTIAVIGAALILGAFAALIISFIRSRKRKKEYEKE